MSDVPTSPMDADRPKNWAGGSWGTFSIGANDLNFRPYLETKVDIFQGKTTV